MPQQIDWHGRTDPGQVRASNQDQYLIADLCRLMTLHDTSLPQPDHQRLVGNLPGKLLVVADGVGGHVGGEHASSIAVKTVSCYVLNMMQWFLKLSDEHESEFRDELAECLAVCEADVRKFGDGNSRYAKMGTTVTLAYVVWPRMYVVHAGDSRCYLLRNGRLDQITHDHSMAQLLVDTGGLERDEAATSRYRHVLWNAIGANGQNVQAEVGRVDLQQDDLVLLCSDGLHGPVSEESITEILTRQSGTAEQMTEQLIAAANDAGGPDNITAVVARFGLPPDPEEECDF